MSQTSTLKQNKTILSSKLWHTHLATVSSTDGSLYMKETQREKEKLLRTYLANCIWRGWKSSMPNITSWKVEIQQLIKITVYNTELWVLKVCYLRAFQCLAHGGSWWSWWLRHHIQQQQHCCDLPPCTSHHSKCKPCSTRLHGFSIHPLPFYRLHYG